MSDIPAITHRGLEISINPKNDEELWVGNSEGGSNEKIYRTINGGQSWTNETTSTIQYIDLHDIIFINGTASNPKDRVYIASSKTFHFKHTTDKGWDEYAYACLLYTSPSPRDS